jgi:hypothetical protein
MSPAPATQVAKHRSKRLVPSTQPSCCNVCFPRSRASAWGRSRPLEQRHLPAALLPIAALRAPIAAMRYASAARLGRLKFRDRPGADIERARRERSFISMQTTAPAFVPQPRRERTTFVAVAPPWHRLGPILTLARCIEDHHGNDSRHAPLCRSITSSSTG